MTVRLFWSAIVGFLIGVFVWSIWQNYNLYLIAITLFAVSVWVMPRKLIGYALCVSIGSLFFVTGILRMDSAGPVQNAMYDAQIGKSIEFVGYVSDQPNIRNTSTAITVTNQDGISVLASVPQFTRVSYGDNVSIKGKLELAQNFDSTAGRIFNYRDYLATKGIGYSMSFANIRIDGEFGGYRVVYWAIEAKNRFISGINSILSEPQSSLASGITVGGKSGFSEGVKDEFRATSLLHILVLSGYNISVFVGVVLAYSVRLPRIWRYLVAGCVAVFFAIMTGFDSASLRASLMAIIAISGAWSGRIYRADRALALVAFAMVVWNPRILLHDPGFQLSVLATAGLLLFAPIFEIYFQKVWYWVREALVATCSAQIAVLPLILFQSGILSIVSLPANLLVLPVVPYAMIASAIASIAGAISSSGIIFSQQVAIVLALPAQIMLSWILGVAHYLASAPYSAVEIGAFGAWWLAPIYFMIIIIAIYLRQDIRRGQKQ